MDGFAQQLSERLDLATAVLESFHFAFDEQRLQKLYDRHRGRCYSDVLTFPRFLEMVRDALLQHGGSGHRLCTQEQRLGQLPVDESNFYRKLSRMPQSLSRALLRECTVRLSQLILPQQDLLPGCFQDLEVVVLDGKKIKNAAKRLKPTRGYSGSLLGAKALVAMDLRTGLALAMSDSLDGQANDVPLVPELLPQVREVIGRPILWIADRQFGDLHIPTQLTERAELTERAGDHFVLRVRKGVSFQADPQVPVQRSTVQRSTVQRSTVQRSTDEKGQKIIDEIGMLGRAKAALRVRRVTLKRTNAAGQDDDVVLITDLLDSKIWPAADLLKLYRRRWGIEQMFQQVTETFGLQHLIGSSPRAVLFQMAFCLLMYNLIQVLQGYVAEDGRVPRSVVSTAKLFYDVKRELQTWSYFNLPGPQQRWPEAGRMQQRLRELLRGSWDPIAYTKAADKKPRPPRPRQRLHGGHSSVQRLLEGRVKIHVPRN